MALSHEEKLDLILNECKDHYGHFPIKENWQRICRLVTDGDGVSTGNPDYETDPLFFAYITALIEDGYISKFNNKSFINYLATVKGLTFEGFKNKSIRIRQEGENQRRLSDRVFWLTVVTAVGGGGILLFDIWKWVYDHFCFCH